MRSESREGGEQRRWEPSTPGDDGLSAAPGEQPPSPAAGARRSPPTSLGTFPILPVISAVSTAKSCS